VALWEANHDDSAMLLTRLSTWLVRLCHEPGLGPLLYDSSAANPAAPAIDLPSGSWSERDEGWLTTRVIT
jgi:hypothetical protein